MKEILRKIIPKQKISRVSIFTVGAQKSGTSALHDYLIKHPNVMGGFKKEINFFHHPEKYEQGFKWYHQQYNKPLFFRAKKIFIDSTPGYLYSKNVAEKIYSYNPNAIIVILLREPISRAYSAWNMYRQFSNETDNQKILRVKRAISEHDQNNFLTFLRLKPFPSFDQYVSEELNNNKLLDTYPNVIKNGIYADQIKPYIDLFGLNKVLIFESNYFKNNRLKVTNIVLDAAKITNLELNNYDLKDIHARKYEKQINKTTEEKLRIFYQPHNERLFSLITQKFDW